MMKHVPMLLLGAACLLSGCVTGALPERAEARPEPPLVWTKPGGTQGEFERAKAKCNLMRWSVPLNDAMVVDPIIKLRSVFDSCMVLEGWTLVQQK